MYTDQEIEMLKSKNYQKLLAIKIEKIQSSPPPFQLVIDNNGVLEEITDLGEFIFQDNSSEAKSAGG